MVGKLPNNPPPVDGQPTVVEVAEEAIDPRELVTKGGYYKDPREIVADPAVTPQMYDTMDDLRGDLTRDEDEQD